MLLLACAVNGKAAAIETFDLLQGSIVITEEDGQTVFTQGDTSRTIADKSAIVRQSDTSSATANTISVQSGEVTLTIVGLNVSYTADDSSPISVSSGAKLTLKRMDNSAGEIVQIKAIMLSTQDWTPLAAAAEFSAG